MRYRFLIISLFSLCTTISHAQEIYILHKQVGDTITKNEAFSNYIFQDLKVDDYTYAVVYKLQHRYRVDFSKDNIIKPVFIDQEKIDLYYNNIEKIKLYLTQKLDTSAVSSDNMLKKEYASTQQNSADPIVFFSSQELKDIGLSGVTLTEEGRERIESERKEKEQIENRIIQVKNEFVEYGSENALFKFNKPLRRKNKVLKQARENLEK